MAFFGDALAHAILPGVAVGYLIGGGATGPLFWGALIAGIGTALGIGAISKSGQIKEDTGHRGDLRRDVRLGVALISSARNFSVDLTHFLVRATCLASPRATWW